ncbi:Lrp/AsnC family transcriptional regulator [Streptomyces cavernicola]|uniref:AsnC family transcriptional regulator n=1 Tax=Streptomyces cavernicola TaxID=3043613 RepID=A0ABT6S7U2_9ACTN|nr:AsnC family transcriptional regulator [Streptomyces sp. B-S-A6]MDI3404177.1 AsnC family transcriptional regulator [Streptomyces sp. B-S-A6]
MTDDAQDSFTTLGIDETDLSLVHALQLDPRAPWTKVGAALDLDPVTVARRWARMADAGLAWVTPQMGQGQSARAFTAVVEVHCEAGRSLEVAATLARQPHAFTVEHTTGSRDLLVTVALPSLATLSRYLVESLGALPGVRETRSHLVTSVHAQGGDWRPRALDPQQRAQLATDGPERATTAGTRRLTDQDRQLMLLLCADGRAPLTDLAAELGVSVSTVRRRLHALAAGGDLELRCEVAQPLSGWPIATWLLAEVPGAEREEIARQLAELPETRVCLGLTGSRGNLSYSAWLRSLDDAERLEQLLAQRFPRLVVLDRAVVLRFVKRMGRLLDPVGRSVGVVPMDVWSDPFDEY